VIRFVSSVRRNGKVRKRLKRRVLKLQGNLCAFCNTELNNSVDSIEFQPTLDHKFALSLGGDWSEDNLQILHGFCNQMKKLIYDEDFVSLVIQYEYII